LRSSNVSDYYSCIKSQSGNQQTCIDISWDRSILKSSIEGSLRQQLHAVKGLPEESFLKLLHHMKNLKAAFSHKGFVVGTVAFILAVSAIAAVVIFAVK